MSVAGSLRVWFLAQRSTFPRPAARRPVGPAYLISISRTRERVSTVPGKARSKAGKICSSRLLSRLIARVHSWVRSASKPERTLQCRENLAVAVDRA
jgi:hypothetical protein